MERMLEKKRRIPLHVVLGQQLLDLCEEGDTSKVCDLMCKGPPFTTDWVNKIFQYSFRSFG